MAFENQLKTWYLTNFLRSLYFSAPIWVLLYLNRGLNFGEILILQGWYMFAALAFQIPVGILSDIYGSKPFLIFGSLLAATGSFTLATATKFLGFLGGETLWGMSEAFLVTPSNSYIYELLKSERKIKISKKVFSKTSSLFYLGLGSASALGGFLADIDIALPMLAQVPVFILCAVMSLKFKETPRLSRREALEHRKSIISKNLKYVLKHKLLFLLILNSAFITTLIYAGGTLYPPYLTGGGIALGTLGVIFGIIYLADAAGAFTAHRMDKALGVRRMVLLSGVIPAVGFAALAAVYNPLFGILFITMISIMVSMREPLFSDYINSKIGTRYRTTVLSIEATIAKVSAILFNPMLGYVVDVADIRISFLCLGALLFVLALVLRVEASKS